MSQADDIEAVNVYIANSRPKTAAAGKVRDEWIRWHDGLSWWEKMADSAAWDKARNYRNEFNRLNAVTPEQKEQVEQVIQTGLTSEEQKGEAKRIMTDGTYEEPVLSTKTKLVLGTTLGLVVAAGAAVGVGVLFVKSTPAMKALGEATDAFRALRKRA